MNRYTIFGLTLVSDYPFSNQLATTGFHKESLLEADQRTPEGGSSIIEFTCVEKPPLHFDWERAVPAYASPTKIEDGRSSLYLYRLGICDVLRFTNVADFYLWSNHIVCHLLDPRFDHMVEIYLLGSALSYWLEREGVPTLHASAVVVKGRALVFLGDNKGGKSSLAASLMQAGYPLLTDDLLPFERRGDAFHGRSGYPTMRMWPEEAQYFLGYYQDLELVHPDLSKRRVPVGRRGWGAFCSSSRELACIYLLDHSDTNPLDPRVMFTPIPPKDALIELLRHSFSPRLSQVIGSVSKRLGFFAQLAEQVPVRRLAYPKVYEHLSFVRDAILQDVERILRQTV